MDIQLPIMDGYTAACRTLAASHRLHDEAAVEENSPSRLCRRPE
jgi:CheY-like chemotaxis protein